MPHGRAFGRFECTRPNEMRAGDTLHGPVIGGAKSYLFAFVDDHSRAVMGARWAHHDDVVRMAAAFRPALQARVQEVYRWGLDIRTAADHATRDVEVERSRAVAALQSVTERDAQLLSIYGSAGTPPPRDPVERFRIPRACLAAQQPVVLTFFVRWPFVPADHDVSDDFRALGLFVHSIRFPPS